MSVSIVCFLVGLYFCRISSFLKISTTNFLSGLWLYKVLLSINKTLMLSLGGFMNYKGLLLVYFHSRGDFKSKNNLILIRLCCSCLPSSKAIMHCFML